MKNAIKKLLKTIGLLRTVQKTYDFIRLYPKNRRKRAKRRMREKIMRSYDPSPFYLNVGSSLFVRKNWRLLDYSGSHCYEIGDLGELLDYNIDLTTCPKLPIPDNSVDLLFSAHCLEHIGYGPTQNVFNEAYRIMKRGGVFRIAISHVDRAYEMYKKNNKEWFLTLKARKGDEGLPIEWYYFRQLCATFTGNRFQIRQMRKDVEMLSKEDFFKKYHYNMPNDVCVPYRNTSGYQTWFNFDKMKKMLQNAGFSDIRHSSFLQSISEEMRAPEFDTRKGTLKGDTREKVSLYIDIVR